MDFYSGTLSIIKSLNKKVDNMFQYCDRYEKTIICKICHKFWRILIFVSITGSGSTKISTCSTMVVRHQTNLADLSLSSLRPVKRYSVISENSSIFASTLKNRDLSSVVEDFSEQHYLYHLVKSV